MRERQCLTGDCLGNDTQTADHCPDCNYFQLLDLSILYYLSPASCGPWSDWGSCPDSSCSQIRTKECTETCDEGEIFSELQTNRHLIRPLEQLELLDLLQSLLWWVSLQVSSLHQRRLYHWYLGMFWKGLRDSILL